MLPRGRPRKGMTYNTVLKCWEAIPGAEQAIYYQKKKPDFQVRVCQPRPTHTLSQLERYEKEEKNTKSSTIDQSAPLTSAQQPSATETAEIIRMKRLRQPWETAKSIAAHSPKCNVYSLDSDGNFFNAREQTTDPYSVKKQCSERFYMKKITVTGVVYGPNKKYDLEAGEWEERDDIVKMIRVRY